MIVFESLNNVDWNLLHEQKLLLLTLVGRHPEESPEAEALLGLTNLLDAIQDEAAEAGIWTFPDDPEEASATPLPPKRYYVEDDDGHHHGPLDNYEEAATVADAIHGRIIAQDTNEPSVAPNHSGGEEVHDGQA